MKTTKTAVSFAVQVRAMCGDRNAQAALRVELVRAAVVVAVKGNATQWLDGAKEAASIKSTVAKAMQAGFAAVGAIGVLIKPQDAKNMAAEERAAKIEAHVDGLMTKFEEAFNAAMPKELTDAEKQAKKDERAAAKAAAIAAAAEAQIKERGLVEAGTLASDGDIVNAFLALVKGGKVGDALLDDVRAALGVPALVQAAYLDGKAAAESLAADAGAAVGPILAKASKPRKQKGTAPAAPVTTQEAPALA